MEKGFVVNDLDFDFRFSPLNACLERMDIIPLPHTLELLLNESCALPWGEVEQLGVVIC